jgi:pimeloyl-ACP methyl ester carboxylesterase
VEVDLDKLLAAADEPGPYILAGHSMAGLYVRLFAGRHPDQVAGVVLIDAAAPGATASGPMKGFVGTFTTISRMAGWGASAGLLKPFAFAGDMIGLTGRAAEEKRWAFANGSHNRAAAAEVAQWMRTAEEAGRYGAFDPALPVAVVTAGNGPPGWKRQQAAPARGSLHGDHRNIPGASHATLLGERYADEIVKAIDHVRAAVAAKAEPG